MSSRHAIKVAQAPCLRMSTPVYYLNAAPAHTCAPPCYVMLVPGCGMVQHGSVPVLMRGAHVCGSGTLGQGGGILPVEQIVHVVFGAYDRLQQYPNWKQILDSYVTRKKGNQVWRDMYRFPETCPEDYRDWFNNLNYHQTEDLLNLALRWSNKHRPDSGVAAATPAAVGDLKPLEQIIDVVFGAYERLKQYPDWKKLLDSYVQSNRNNAIWCEAFKFPSTTSEDYSQWFNKLSLVTTRNVLNEAKNQGEYDRQVQQLQTLLRHPPKLQDWNEWLESRMFTGQYANVILRDILYEASQDNPDKYDTTTTVSKAYEKIKNQYFEACRLNSWTI